MKVLVTGSSGYIGRRVMCQLDLAGYDAVPFDLPHDVLDEDALTVASQGVDACIHLAAHKHAGHGEDDPATVALDNINGVQNVVAEFGPNVVFASTCKAADPMTCYGASKLIGERIVLNAGGRVVRLVNVEASSGSVLELWADVPENEPLPVTQCERMWMTAEQAAWLFVRALKLPSGRYAPDAGEPVPVWTTAAKHFPGRHLLPMPLRRGDRPVERLVAEYERSGLLEPGVVQITSTFSDLPTSEHVGEVAA